jgi:pimeloyl-ACP methyl ester carboxylesterase
VTSTYVFVHGSGGTARNWSHIQQEMGIRGHRTVAVDLPGRGAGISRAYYEQDLATFAAQPSVMAGMTAKETIGHVVDVVRRVSEHGPVVLVGHSFGGIVVTGVGNAVPELLERMVYIAAQCPVDQAPGAYPTLPEWSTSRLFPATLPIIVRDPNEAGFIRLNWLGADRAQREALRQAIAGDLTEDEFIPVVTSAQPDEVSWLNVPEWDHRAEKDTWGRIPRAFIRLTNDHSMPLAAQDLYIKEADALTPGNPFTQHSIHTSHSGFFRRPAEVAEMLAG